MVEVVEFIILLLFIVETILEEAPSFTLHIFLHNFFDCLPVMVITVKHGETDHNGGTQII